MRIVEFPIAHFTRDKEDLKTRMQTVEETGKGNLLCYEAFGGRLFRSGEEAVKKDIKAFIDEYNMDCKRTDEDPAHKYLEVYCFNDLYEKLGIRQTQFGSWWGYTTDEDYRQDIEFDFYLLKDRKDTYFEDINEDILLIELRPYSFPTETYMDV